MATMADIAKKVGVSKGTVSKAINGAPDISETLRKTILETAVELGYLRARRGAARTLAILVANMGYTKPEDFGTDIVTGFRQMAEPAGYNVEVTELSVDLERTTRYDEYMLQQGYLGALLLGLSLEDPWLEDFRTSHTPAVLYDNLVQRKPTVATLGMDNNETVGQAVAALRAMGHRKVSGTRAFSMPCARTTCPTTRRWRAPAFFPPRHWMPICPACWSRGSRRSSAAPTCWPTPS